MTKRKRDLRKKKAANIAASLATSGVGMVNIKKVSPQTLEAIISKSKKNSPLARAAASELAERGSRVAKRKKIKVR